MIISKCFTYLHEIWQETLLNICLAVTLTFGIDLLRNGLLIHSYLSIAIFLIHENEKSLIAQKWCEVERFGGNFWHEGYTRNHLALFPKIFLPPFLMAILNLCVKDKNPFISETVQYRVNLT